MHKALVVRGVDALLVLAPIPVVCVSGGGTGAHLASNLQQPRIHHKEKGTQLCKAALHVALLYMCRPSNNITHKIIWTGSKQSNITSYSRIAC